MSGRRGYVSREDVADFDDTGKAVPGLTKTQGLNEFLDAQYAYEQAQREQALAEQDAVQTAQRKEQEAAQADAEKQKEKVSKKVNRLLKLRPKKFRSNKRISLKKMLFHPKKIHLN